MTPRTRIIRTRVVVDLLAGVVLIGVGTNGSADPVSAELWIWMGIVAVGMGLVLLVALAFGRNLQEVADRYPWTAGRWLAITLALLSIGVLLIAYPALHATPAGPVLRYTGLGLWLLALLAPGARTPRARAEQDAGLEAA
jgi:hypothetical protein